MSHDRDATQSIEERGAGGENAAFSARMGAGKAPSRLRAMPGMCPTGPECGTLWQALTDCVRRVDMPKVRDAIRQVERDGWVLDRMRGSHRIYEHPTKLGIVVIAGQEGTDLPQGTWYNILRQAGLK